MAKAPTRERVWLRREALRKRGLRPILIRVPGVRAAGFIEEARRQGRLVASSAYAVQDQAYADSLAEMDV